MAGWLVPGGGFYSKAFHRSTDPTSCRLLRYLSLSRLPLRSLLIPCEQQKR
jgi:hypothetical protein